MIRPTRKAAACFALSAPVALVVVALFPGAWYVSLYLPVLAFAAVLADATMALPGRRLDAELAVPVRLYVGQRGEAACRIAIAGRTGTSRPASIVALLELEGDAEEPYPVTGIPEEGRLDLPLVIMPLRRGRVRVAALWLRWRGPLGLTEMRRRQTVDTTVDVVPDLRGIHDAALQFFARDAVYGVKTQRMRGEGTEFETLREYMPGMDNRFMDWKRSARHRKLLCKEFRQERNHQIVLGFDTGRLMLEPISGMPKLDHAIAAGLLLGWVSLHGGDLVGGCGFDAHFHNFLKPGRGMPYFTRLQKLTAALDYRTEETNFTLGLMELNARLQRRALVVVFTEFVDAVSAELLLESLQLMARKHAVIFVTFRDPLLAGLADAPPENFHSAAQSVLADNFLRERTVVLERVARLGVHCVDTPARELSGALLNRYLMIKQRGLL